jgi:hypothetical protein
LTKLKGPRPLQEFIFFKKGEANKEFSTSRIEQSGGRKETAKSGDKKRDKENKDQPTAYSRF